MPRIATGWELLKQTFKDWKEDRAPRLAAALAYYTVFSIAPLLLITISVAALSFGRQAAEEQILGFITKMVGENSAQAIAGMLEAANKSRSGLIATIVGGFTLIFGATGVFMQLQDAMNTVWKVKPKDGQGIKGVLLHRLVSLGIVLAIGVLILASLVVSAFLSSTALPDWIPGGAQLWRIVSVGVDLAVLTLLFALLLKYLPDVKIAWRNVWMGAALTAVLFGIGKFALGLYLGRVAVSSAYGAAGSIIVLLLWIYYSAQIFLFGAEFTQVHATRFAKSLEPTDNATWLPGHKTLPQAGGA
jgi:membrane protein